MSGAYEPISSGTNATFRVRCFWNAYGSMSWAAQLTALSADGHRFDWSFQTNTHAKHACPDDGVASAASPWSPYEHGDGPGGDYHIGEGDPERVEVVGDTHADRDVDRRRKAVAEEDPQVRAGRQPFPQRSQSHVRSPSTISLPHEAQTRSARRTAFRRPGSASAPANAAARRTEATSGSSTATWIRAASLRACASSWIRHRRSRRSPARLSRTRSSSSRPPTATGSPPSRRCRTIRSGRAS